MISIDEAIAHEREEAEEIRENIIDGDNLEPYESYCNAMVANSAEEHEQIAEWLEELKDYRDKNKVVIRIDCTNSEKFNDIAVKLAKEQYNKAIDDIKEKLMKNGFIYTQHALDVFNELSEQLKVGVKE